MKNLQRINGGKGMEKMISCKAIQETGGSIPGSVIAPHSSVLDWRVPWTEEPGGLPTAHGVAKSQTEQSS